MFTLSFRCHDRDSTGCQDWDYDILSMIRISPLYSNEKVWIFIVCDHMLAKASDYKVIVNKDYESNKKNLKKFCEVGDIAIKSQFY